MPKTYSDDLRERLIAAVRSGMSRNEAADVSSVAISTAVKLMQRLRDTGSAAAKPRGGSTSRLEQHTKRILAVCQGAAGRDLERDPGGVARIVITSPARRKACGPPNRNARTWRERAARGSASRVCLIPPSWYLSTRPA